MKPAWTVALPGGSVFAPWSFIGAVQAPKLRLSAVLFAKGLA